MCWSFECFTQAISIHIKLIDLRHDFAWIFIVVALFCQFKLGNWHGSKFSPTRADNATKMFRSNRHNHVSNIFVQNKMIIKKHLFLSLVLVSNERTNKQLAIPLTNFILIWLLMPQAIDTIHFGFSPPPTQLSASRGGKMLLMDRRMSVTEATTSSSYDRKLFTLSKYRYRHACKWQTVKTEMCESEIDLIQTGNKADIPWG